MTKFAEFGNFSYHVNGDYIPRVDQYYIRISSQFSDSRFPDELRKNAEYTLSGQQLDALITKLQNIRASKPASLPVETYGWLNQTLGDYPLHEQV